MYLYTSTHTHLSINYIMRREHRIGQLYPAIVTVSMWLNNFYPQFPPLFMSSESILSIRPSATKRGIKLRQSGKISPQEASNGEN